MLQATTPTVWIVDDDEDDRLFIRNAFEQSYPPITVLTLNDGAALLPVLADCVELPRLILLDVNMPLKNGFETLSELRNIPEFADLPVVMLTTSSATADRERSLALGANSFLTKPLKYEELKLLAKELAQQWELT